MVAFIIHVISYLGMLLFGATGEIVTEKSGHLNMGTPGIMCIGAVGAAIGSRVYIDAVGVDNLNVFLGILIPTGLGMIFGAVAGLLYCFIVDTLKCNQNVTGLAITTLGAGLLKFVAVSFPNGNSGFQVLASSYYEHLFPKSFYESNWFTELFFSYSFLIYLAIIIAVLAMIILKRTRVGLSLRAIGENPGTADACGINVTRYKYLSTLIGSCISSLGGVYYLLAFSSGSFEFALEGFGWLAVALVIFSLWNPGFAILGSLIFSIFYQLSYTINANGATIEIVRLLPYFVTIVVLIVISLFNKRETQPPAALGLPYYREDR